jgi:hypothetical protein
VSTWLLEEEESVREGMALTASGGVYAAVSSGGSTGDGPEDGGGVIMGGAISSDSEGCWATSHDEVGSRSEGGWFVANGEPLGDGDVNAVDPGALG